MYIYIFRKSMFKMCNNKYKNWKMYLNYWKIKVIFFRRQLIKNIFVIAINKKKIEINSAANLFDKTYDSLKSLNFQDIFENI